MTIITEALDKLDAVIKAHEDASLRLDTGEIKRLAYELRAASTPDAGLVEALKKSNKLMIEFYNAHGEADDELLLIIEGNNEALAKLEHK